VLGGRALRALTAAGLIASLGVGAALLVSGCGTASSNSGPAATRAASSPGGKAAHSFSGTTLDGHAVSLDQYEGKPLLLVYITDT
jgi:hypothetical protein